MRAALVIIEAFGLDAISWASDIANSCGQALVVVCVSKDSSSHLDKVSANKNDLLQLIATTLSTLEKPGMPKPEVYDCRGPALHRAVLDAINEFDLQQLVLPMDLDQRSSSAHVATRKLIRAAPVDVLAIDVGQCAEPDRILIPQIDGGGSFAIQYAARCVGRDDLGVRVITDVKNPARSNRVFARAKSKLAKNRQESLKQIEAKLPLEKALFEHIATNDLVLFNAESAPKISQMISKLVNLRQERPDTAFAVGVLRAAHAAGSGRIERTLERLRQHAPMLSREQRRDIHALLDSKGGLSTEFVVMMVLSASIASLGLIQSSTAVVIGAMLVAPLMTPLVAIGMSLVQGNPQLFNRAVKAMVVGIVAALGASIAIGLTSPWSELSAEILARGSPNVFDLFIALLSGVAAAFALARPGLAGTLVGVAIAVALVPPLASVGIATIKGHFNVAFGAGVLFSTNLFAIVVGTAIVFRFFGLNAAKRGDEVPRWVQTVLMIVALGLIPVTAVLISNLQSQLHEGVHRPYARPLPPAVRKAITDRVARSPDVRLIMMAQSEIEDGFGIQILLASPGPADTELERDLMEIIRKQLGNRTPAHVLSLREAAASQSDEPN
ncbi:MAG: DUF389 domain-containing protein [Phycisphaeraceae bacterium]|nr:DUF389 domain-containing protein [Phycisphaerales bacterium]MCB9860522.1 DUF389 domain-containing protein [Phycisphaeraceae bacterium]